MSGDHRTPVELAHLQFAAAVGHDLRGLVDLAGDPADSDCSALADEIERRTGDDVRALLFAAALVLSRPEVRSAIGWTS